MAVVPLSSRSYTALRVLAVVIPIALAMGGTAAVFFAVPQVNDALKLALREGGAAFLWLVILPSCLMAAVTTVLVGRILWSASEPPIGSGGDTGSADLT